MNKHKSQSGFAHLVILTIIVTLGLIGTLGYIYWQNFMQPKTKAPITASTINKGADKKVAAVQYKTFTTGKYNVSFQYPSNWSVTDSSKTMDGDYYYINVEVKNENGEHLAAMQSGAQLGGTCETQGQYTTIEALSTSYKSSDSKPVTLSYTAVDEGDGSYGVHYGLTGYYITVDSNKVCPNTFYYNYGANAQLGGFGFGYDIVDVKKFSSLDDAKVYAKSDEYAQIKKMILSMTY